MTIDPDNYMKFCRDEAEKFRAENPKNGPYWAIKQKFVFLFDRVITLQNQLKSQSLETVEIKPMKITFTSSDIWELIEKHLNEHVVKSPFEVQQLTVFRDKSGQLIPIEDWDSIEVEIKPREGAK